MLFRDIEKATLCLKKPIQRPDDILDIIRIQNDLIENLVENVDRMHLAVVDMKRNDWRSYKNVYRRAKDILELDLKCLRNQTYLIQQLTDKTKRNIDKIFAILHANCSCSCSCSCSVPTTSSVPVPDLGHASNPDPNPNPVLAPDLDLDPVLASALASASDLDFVPAPALDSDLDPVPAPVSDLDPVLVSNSNSDSCPGPSFILEQQTLDHDLDQEVVLTVEALQVHNAIVSGLLPFTEGT